MTTWNDVHELAPDLVDRARTLFGATTNSVLATIRADGSPRVPAARSPGHSTTTVPIMPAVVVPWIEQ